MAKVTIMMATYNGEKYISEQLDSIINQSYKDWELIVSDDGSTDATCDILKKYKEKYPDKIQLLKRESDKHGAKENFVYLYNNCPKSDYYMFSDQDDIWDNNKIQLMVKCIENNIVPEEPCLVYCDLKVVDKNLNILRKTYHDDNIFRGNDKLLLKNYIPGCTMLLNNSLKEKIGKIPSSCVMHDWWIVLYASLFEKIVYCDKGLHLYRQHEENVIGSGGIKKSDKSIIQTILSPYDAGLKAAYTRYACIMDDSIIQAKAFLHQYKNLINHNDRQMFVRYIKIKKNIVKGLLNFIRYYKTGNARADMYYILGVIFCR